MTTRISHVLGFPSRKAICTREIPVERVTVAIGHSGMISRDQTQFEAAACDDRIVSLDRNAGVVQWQNASFPS
jgi:hypothetical protein